VNFVKVSNFDKVELVKIVSKKKKCQQINVALLEYNVSFEL